MASSSVFGAAAVLALAATASIRDAARAGRARTMRAHADRTRSGTFRMVTLAKC